MRERKSSVGRFASFGPFAARHINITKKRKRKGEKKTRVRRTKRTGVRSPSAWADLGLLFSHQHRPRPYSVLYLTSGRRPPLSFAETREGGSRRGIKGQEEGGLPLLRLCVRERVFFSGKIHYFSASFSLLGSKQQTSSPLTCSAVAAAAWRRPFAVGWRRPRGSS